MSQSFDVPSFQQIGTDGRLLPAPLELHYLLLGPGERFDVITDFAGCEGKCFSPINDAPAPYTMGGQYMAEDVMLFKVSKQLSAKDISTVPETLDSFSSLSTSPTLHAKDCYQYRKKNVPLTVMPIIGLLGNARWHEPITCWS